MINKNLLKSRIILLGEAIEEYGTFMGWSSSTTYRKVNGQSDYTAPEIRKTVEHLKLSAEEAQAIFFPDFLSLKDKNES